MEATIYVLKDPRTNEIRYVGCTRNIQRSSITEGGD